MGIMPSLYLITGRYVCVCVHSLDKSVKKKAHRKRDHIGGCQGQGCVEVREASESGQKV